MKTALVTTLAAALLALGGCAAQPNSQEIGTSYGNTVTTLGGGSLGGPNAGIGGVVNGGMMSRR